MSRKAGKKQTKLLISLLARLADTLQSVKPLKAMGRENLSYAVLASDTSSLNRALKKEVYSNAVIGAVQEPLFVAVVAAGIYIALEKMDIPLATVMVLVLLLGRMMGQMGKVQRWYQRMVVAESAYWSLRQAVKDAEKEREVMTGSITPVIGSEIRFDNVCFAYDEKVILKNLSLTVKMGSLTALVGPSGVGKSTVVDLITGLTRPQQGNVFVGDDALEDIDIMAWRHSIGYVPQENVLLHESIFMNIALGDSNISEADVERALKEAGAWDFVQDLPEGVHSLAGERGLKLSGGQRQRIMIARALVNQPKLLILDEATSALDPQSEKEICETLQRLRGERTILAISHQPAIIDFADRVYRLHDGKAALVDGASLKSENFADLQPDTSNVSP